MNSPSGHDLVGHGAGRLVEAGLHGPGVNAVGLDDRDELEGVGDAVAVGHEVVGGDAHENRHVVAAGLVNLVDDLAEEAGAVLGRSAVLVGAVVGVLGKEAHHHVADARVDLDDVDAGILAAAGGLAVLLDDLGDLLFGVLALGHGPRTGRRARPWKRRRTKADHRQRRATRSTAAAGRPPWIRACGTPRRCAGSRG